MSSKKRWPVFWIQSWRIICWAQFPCQKKMEPQVSKDCGLQVWSHFQWFRMIPISTWKTLILLLELPPKNGSVKKHGNIIMTSKLAGKSATPKHNDLKALGNGQCQGFVKELLPSERCESDCFSIWILPSMAVVDCAKKHEACSNTRVKKTAHTWNPNIKTSPWMWTDQT